MQIFVSVDTQCMSFNILAEAHHQQVLECAYIIHYCQLLPIHYIDNEYRQERIAAGPTALSELGLAPIVQNQHQLVL